MADRVFQLDDIDLEFRELRHRVDPEWYTKLLPLVRERYLGASTAEIDAATVESALWADPLRRPRMKEAVLMQENMEIEAELAADADKEPYDSWKLRHDVDDALAHLPDDFTTG